MTGVFFNTEIFLRILLTIPVTLASIERSFSKFKIVRNYSRNTISEKTRGMANIVIKKETSDSV